MTRAPSRFPDDASALRNAPGNGISGIGDFEAGAERQTGAPAAARRLMVEIALEAALG